MPLATDLLNTFKYHIGNLDAKSLQTPHWWPRRDKTFKPYKYLIKNDTQVTNIKDIVDKLAEISANSSSKNSNTEFHKYKDKKKKQKLNFNSDNTESYNGFFSELTEAIQKSHNTSVGPDKIHNEFLRQLPPKSLEYRLTTLNDIWKNSKLPES